MAIRHIQRLGGLARFFSTERVVPVVLSLALLVLDIVPFMAWLVVFAAYYAHDAQRAAMPLWLVWATPLLVWFTAQLHRRLGAILATAMAFAVGAFSLLLTLRFSPATYGDIPGGPIATDWLRAAGADIANYSSRTNASIMLAGLTALLVWRGFSLAHRSVAKIRVRTRFITSFSGVTVAVIAATATTGSARVVTFGVLLALLPIDVFAGLLASALYRAALTLEDEPDAHPETANTTRWLLMAPLLAFAVVGVAAIVSGVLNFDSVLAALSILGPVGAALSHFLEWAVNGFAALLSYLFNGQIDSLKQALNPARATLTPRPVSSGPLTPLNNQSPGWQQAAVVILGIFVSLALLLAALWFIRLVLGRPVQNEDDVVVEERESLEGQKLFAEQLRGLFGRFAARRIVGEEELARGSVRQVYREVLREAQAQGIGRADAETADEFAIRIQPALSGQVAPDELATLTGAYVAARYGEGDDANQNVARSAARHITDALHQQKP